MAEPVGITGTAAGLVSLGLQLHGEISKYIDAVKGRRRELDAAKRSADTLQKCLTAIDEIIDSVTAQSTASEAVETCRISCEDEINALKALVERLIGPLAPADTLSAKVKEKSRQLTYPFRRGDVLELEKRLESTNNRLQTALHTLELNILRSTQDLVTAVHSNVQAVRLATDRSGVTLATIANTVSNIESSSGHLEHLIPEIRNQTTRTFLLVSQQAHALSQTSQVSIRVAETAQQAESRFDRTDEILLQLVKGQREMNQQMLQLVARPSHLRSLCDQFPKESPAGLTRPGDTGSLGRRRADYKYRPCPCTRRRKLQRNERTFGPLFLETEYSETTHHATYCRLSRITPPEQQSKRGFGITIPALQSILDKAIRISLSLNTGAGGLSFSQSLSWVATVDSARSPAFRLLRLTCRALHPFGHSLSRDQSLKVINSCLNRLAWCYEQRIASPADVQQDGLNLLAVVVPNIQPGAIRRSVSVRFVRRLLELGIPVNTSLAFNSDDSILSFIMKYYRATDPKQAYGLSAALKASGADCVRLGVENAGYVEVIDAFQLLKTFPDYAEMLNVGSLAMAILRQDLPAVRELVEKYPSSLWEKDNDGLTAIHTAVLVGNNQILGLILRFSNADLVNTTDSSDRYPIDYAMEAGFHEACQLSNDQHCSGCETVEALLQSGSALTASSLRTGLGMYHSDVVNLSKAIRHIVLRYLKERRMKLQYLATRRLPRKDCCGLGFSPLRVLDRHAIQTQRLLETRLGKVPPELIVFDGKTDIEDFGNGKTVYAYIWDRKTAQYAWELGFDDIGRDAVDGFDQLVRRESAIVGVEMRRGVVAYASWLVRHGLKLKVVVEVADAGDSKTTYSHYLMAFLGGNIHIGYERLTLRPEVSSAVFSEPVKDGCLCGCASGGCSPLAKFLRRSGHDCSRWRSSFDRHGSSFEVCRFIFGMIPRKERSSDQYSWIYRGILRHFTFAVLGLRHTCCGPTLGRRQGMDDENVEEIRNEEKDGLLLLETLVAEFEVRCGRNSNLVRFLKEYWEPRMEQVIKDIDRRRLTKLEIRTAEQLGVVWHSDGDSVVSDTYSHGSLDFEDAMKRMDDIAPDPRRRP